MTITNNNRIWWVLAGSTLLYLATTADGPNFNATLPTIQDYFDASAGQIQLLTTVAQLCAAAFVLAAGSLSDLFGRKRIFLLGGVIFNAVMMLGFVGSFLMAGNRGFANPAVLIAMVLGLVFLLIFIWWERRTPNPALQLSLFHSPVFLSAFLAGFGVFFVLMPINPLMQIYFQDVLAYSALTASMALIPLSLGTTLSGPFAGRLTNKMGSRGSILIGISTMLAGTLLLSTLGFLPPYWVVGLGLGLVAVGYGLANPPRVDALMSSTPDQIAGAASSSNSVGVESGSAAGMALSTTLAMAFAGQAFVNLGTEAGLSPDQIQKAVDVLRSAMNDSLNTYPGVSKSVLNQLFEDAPTAFSMGVAQTMLLLALILLVSGVFIWFGMREYQYQPAEEAV